MSEKYKIQPIHVVVVDDVCRFALHLARYLGFELGFGVGRIPWHGKSFTSTGAQWETPFWNWETNEPKEWCSDNRMVYLWWVPAVDSMEEIHNEDDWEKSLKKVFVKIREIHRSEELPEIVAVVDVRGRLRDGKACAKSYSPENVVSFLIDKDAIKPLEENGDSKADFSSSVYIVSSYVVGSFPKKRYSIQLQGNNESGQQQSETDKAKIDPGDWLQLPIRPKSPETFRMIQKNIHDRISKKTGKWKEDHEFTPNSGEHSPKALHFLVTGAGFELRGRRDITALGLNPTSMLLESLGSPFRKIEKKSEEKKVGYRDSFEEDLGLDFQLVTNGKNFPKLRLKNGWNKLGPQMDPLSFEEAFQNAGADLDLWWDLAIWQAIGHKLDPYSTDYHQVLKEGRIKQARRSNLVGKHDRLESQIDSIETEYRMRDAFRKIIMDYDWGHMRQAIMAAGLGWSCWFTTNYTRFADRGIQLLENLLEFEKQRSSHIHSDFWRFGNRSRISFPNQHYKLWRVIGTENAAERLLTGHLHRARNSHPQTGAPQHVSFDEQVKRRYLFKLHGDIGQLHTMAIAGYDKEPYTPLSMNVDAIGKIYSAAQTYLTQKCSLEDGVKAVWHIVGHGLADKLLTGLMGLNVKTEFILVSPGENGEKMFRNLVDTNLQINAKVIYVKATGAEYLSRLWLHCENQLPTIASIEALFPDSVTHLKK